MNIGLVLSGGMAKGAFQIGALKALSSFIPLEEIKHISCASVGVLNGYAYMTGNLDKAEYEWRNICNDSSRLYISRLLKNNILDSKAETICTQRNELKASFYSALFDINTKNIVYKDLTKVEKNQLPQYLKACIALPMYNKSVKIDGAAFFDGAIIDNIPVYPLMQKKLDYLICIYFDDVCYKFENTNFDNKIIKITFPSSSVLKQSMVLKKESIENMIDVGYEKTTEILSKIFANGYKDTEFIYEAIQKTHTENKNLRITGDVFVTNLNKITQQLAKRKIL